MKNALLYSCIIILVLLGVFFAFYLRKEPMITPSAPNPSTAPVSLPTSAKIQEKLIQVGILGESRSNGMEELSFNQDILTRLFNILDKHDVRLVFFTGNLTFGWTKPNKEVGNGLEQDQNIEHNNNANIIYQKKAPVTDWKAKGYIYDPIVFRNQLSQFYALVNSSFSKPIAFYSMMGNHEAIGPNTTEIFKDELNLNKIAQSSGNQLRYTVSIGNAFFAVVPTNYYDSEKQQIVEHSLSTETLTWLGEVLKEAKPNYRYLFVLGHEPAYSSPSIFNTHMDLDNNPEQRDRFWGILKENGVLAYFSSHEHVYDRSNRDGIWQIVSGGGGSPLNEDGQNNHAFFHCLLLSIPQDEKDVPSVTVFDKDGNTRDYFELTSERQALHQFRISRL